MVSIFSRPQSVKLDKNTAIIVGSVWNKDRKSYLRVVTPLMAPTSLIKEALLCRVYQPTLIISRVCFDVIIEK